MTVLTTWVRRLGRASALVTLHDPTKCASVPLSSHHILNMGDLRKVGLSAVLADMIPVVPYSGQLRREENFRLKAPSRSMPTPMNCHFEVYTSGVGCSSVCSASRYSFQLAGCRRSKARHPVVSRARLSAQKRRSAGSVQASIRLTARRSSSIVREGCFSFDRYGSVP